MRQIKEIFIDLGWMIFAALTWVFGTFIALFFTLLPFALITAVIVVTAKFVLSIF